MQEDGLEEKHYVETHEDNKIDDAKVAEGALADYKLENTEKNQDDAAITVQDNEVVCDKIEKQGGEENNNEGNIAKPDSFTSNVKHYDGQNAHQPVTNLFEEHQTNIEAGKQLLNVTVESESKSTEEKDELQKQQNFKQPVRIEAQQHMAPTLSC